MNLRAWIAPVIRFFQLKNVLIWAVGLTAGLVPWYLSQIAPSIVVEALREDDGTVVRGGSLDIMTMVSKTKDCPRHIDRWLFRCLPDATRCDPHDVEPNEAQWVPILSTPGIPIPMGDHVRYMVSLPLPPNVTPGEWYFMGRGRDECSWWPGFLARPVRTSPNARVTVTNPTSDRPATVTAPPGPVTVLPTPEHAP